MIYSRDEIIWTAPTHNVDGTEISYPLDYELGVSSDGGATIEPKVTVVGTLQQDGRYTAPISDMAWETGEYALALRAINRDFPEYMSVWSNTVPLVVSDPTPAAPVMHDA